MTMLIQENMLAVVVALVGLIAAVITVAGPVLRKRVEEALAEKWLEIEMQLPESVLAVIQEVARIAVITVESLHLEDESRDKLKRAEEIAESWLDALGYDVELDRIREAIEYVLFELNQTGAFSHKP